MRSILPLLLLAGCSPHGAAGGGGIVSTNPCADAMLVRLLPPSRIAAISHYSQDEGATSISLAVARRFRATAGTAEEVLTLSPDLVVASSFTPVATREAFARAGLKTLYLDAPQTIEASRAQVRDLARAVGATAAGERMVARIDRTLAATRAPAGPSALLYIAGDLATGSGTLLDAMMTHVGFRNAAARYGLSFTGRLPAEQIVGAPPAVVIAPGGGRAAMLRRRLLPGVPEARLPRSLVNCGGPVMVPALRRLAAIRQGMGR
ncbi:cobalamin ABC transporter substrate-binding protein [Sphingomonas metalli]|uniref:Cobalamin ABC transporter substrate-binding protein n=1 Tax=Sphingomonas metalli TaxID=1779358 RepID=A0A916SUB1_9SPHN|nr:ABC transporter substrate-binding protein [Sphingomonas metalli]GGB17394.1 cobalamin ABC transporter substrate-binding protein [Sphingomonas metalli]